MPEHVNHRPDRSLSAAQVDRSLACVGVIARACACSLRRLSAACFCPAKRVVRRSPWGPMHHLVSGFRFREGLTLTAAAEGCASSLTPLPRRGFLARFFSVCALVVRRFGGKGWRCVAWVLFVFLLGSEHSNVPGALRLFFFFFIVSFTEHSRSRSSWGNAVVSTFGRGSNGGESRGAGSGRRGRAFEPPWACDTTDPPTR